MDKERARFLSGELRDARVEWCDSHDFGGRLGVMVTECVGFSDHRWGQARLKKESGTRLLVWANIIFHDEKLGISVLYDSGYLDDAKPAPFTQDPGPYGAVIALDPNPQNPREPRGFLVRYGSFWYDQDGVLQVVKPEQIPRTQSQAGHHIPFVVFTRAGDGAWTVFRIRSFTESALAAAGAKPIQPESNALQDGQELVIDEIVYRLTQERGRMLLTQRTMAGHRGKEIEVPASIDIPEWKETLGSLEAGWVEAFKRFPVKIEFEV